MLQDYLIENAHLLGSYVKKNWGSPFIFGFMILLVSAGFYLSFGISILSDTLAVYAFYSLIVGVALQLACFLKYPPKEGENI